MTSVGQLFDQYQKLEVRSVLVGSLIRAIQGDRTASLETVAGKTSEEDMQWLLSHLRGARDEVDAEMHQLRDLEVRGTQGGGEEG